MNHDEDFLARLAIAAFACALVAAVTLTLTQCGAAQDATAASYAGTLALCATEPTKAGAMSCYDRAQVLYCAPDAGLFGLLDSGACSDGGADGQH